MKKLNIRNISMLGVLIALDVVATRFLGFQALTVRISFGSVFIILAGLWYGPLEGALVGGMADVIGCMLAGTGFFPPLTLSPIVMGILIGMARPWLVKKMHPGKLLLVVAGANMVTTMGIATWGLAMLYGTSFGVLFVGRIWQYVVNTVIYTVVAYGLYRSAATKVACVWAA